MKRTKPLILLLATFFLLASTACEPANIVEPAPKANPPTPAQAQALNPQPDHAQPSQAKLAKKVPQRLEMPAPTPQSRREALLAQVGKSARHAAEQAPECPMAVAGTRPTALRLDGAGAIDFVTDQDVAELRRQVQKKVKIHQDNHVKPGEMPSLNKKVVDMMVPAQRAVFEEKHEKKRLMRTSTVVGEEIDGGMRVKLTPANPADMDALFVVIQEHADGLKAAGPVCPKPNQRGHVPAQK